MRLKIKILGSRAREGEAERPQETVLRHANVRRRGSERKRIETETRITPRRASIPVEGRMTFGKLRESWKGERDSPGWNRHIALGRAPRSSEFPVINYGVDDRVPSLFLPLSLHPPFAPSPAPLFLLIPFLLLRPLLVHPARPAHPFPSTTGSSLSFFFLSLSPWHGILAPFLPLFSSLFT